MTEVNRIKIDFKNLKSNHINSNDIISHNPEGTPNLFVAALDYLLKSIYNECFPKKFQLKVDPITVSKVDYYFEAEKSHLVNTTIKFLENYETTLELLLKLWLDTNETKTNIQTLIGKGKEINVANLKQYINSLKTLTECYVEEPLVPEADEEPLAPEPPEPPEPPAPPAAPAASIDIKDPSSFIVFPPLPLPPLPDAPLEVINDPSSFIVFPPLPLPPLPDAPLEVINDPSSFIVFPPLPLPPLPDAPLEVINDPSSFIVFPPLPLPPLPDKLEDEEIKDPSSFIVFPPLPLPPLPEAPEEEEEEEEDEEEAKDPSSSIILPPFPLPPLPEAPKIPILNPASIIVFPPLPLPPLPPEPPINIFELDAITPVRVLLNIRDDIQPKKTTETKGGNLSKIFKDNYKENTVKFDNKTYGDFFRNLYDQANTVIDRDTIDVNILQSFSDNNNAEEKKDQNRKNIIPKMIHYDLYSLFNSTKDTNRFNNLIYSVYGVSGSGKTYTLFGKDDDKKYSILDNVIHNINKHTKDKVDLEITLKIYEYYGILSDKYLYNNSNIYNYINNIEDNTSKLEKNSVFIDTDICKHAISYYKIEQDSSFEGKYNIQRETNEEIKKINIDFLKSGNINNLLKDINNYRRNTNLLDKDPEDQNLLDENKNLYILYTPNNPQSSRSYLGIEFGITYKNTYTDTKTENKTITVLDIPGTENKNTIYDFNFEDIKSDSIHFEDVHEYNQYAIYINMIYIKIINQRIRQSKANIKVFSEFLSTFEFLKGDDTDAYFLEAEQLKSIKKTHMLESSNTNKSARQTERLRLSKTQGFKNANDDKLYEQIDEDIKTKLLKEFNKYTLTSNQFIKILKLYYPQEKSSEDIDLQKITTKDINTFITKETIDYNNIITNYNLLFKKYDTYLTKFFIKYNELGFKFYELQKNDKTINSLIPEKIFLNDYYINKKDFKILNPISTSEYFLDIVDIYKQTFLDDYNKHIQTDPKKTDNFSSVTKIAIAKYQDRKIEIQDNYRKEINTLLNFILYYNIYNISKYIEIIDTKDLKKDAFNYILVYKLINIINDKYNKYLNPTTTTQYFNPEFIVNGVFNKNIYINYSKAFIESDFFKEFTKKFNNKIKEFEKINITSSLTSDSARPTTPRPGTARPGTARPTTARPTSPEEYTPTIISTYFNKRIGIKSYNDKGVLKNGEINNLDIHYYSNAKQKEENECDFEKIYNKFFRILFLQSNFISASLLDFQRYVNTFPKSDEKRSNNISNKLINYLTKFTEKDSKIILFSCLRNDVQDTTGLENSYEDHKIKDLFTDTIKTLEFAHCANPNRNSESDICTSDNLTLFIYCTKDILPLKPVIPKKTGGAILLENTLLSINPDPNQLYFYSWIFAIFIFSVTSVYTTQKLYDSTLIPQNEFSICASFILGFTILCALYALVAGNMKALLSFLVFFTLFATTCLYNIPEEFKSANPVYYRNCQYSMIIIWLLTLVLTGFIMF